MTYQQLTPDYKSYIHAKNETHRILQTLLKMRSFYKEHASWTQLWILTRKQTFYVGIQEYLWKTYVTVTHKRNENNNSDGTVDSEFKKEKISAVVSPVCLCATYLTPGCHSHNGMHGLSVNKSELVCLYDWKLHVSVIILWQYLIYAYIYMGQFFMRIVISIFFSFMSTDNILC